MEIDCPHCKGEGRIHVGMWICPECGAGYPDLRVHRGKKYCSGACRQSAYRRRKLKQDTEALHIVRETCNREVDSW